MSEEITETLNKQASPVDGSGDGGDRPLSLEGAILLITTHRVGTLDQKIKDKHGEITERQKEIAFLHKVLRAINADTKDEKLDWTNEEELLGMLEKAKEMGITIPEGPVFDRNERLRLIENIKMATDDLSLENEMGMQSVTRITNERYESYQMARSMLKPLHELKMGIARKFVGR